MDKVVVFDHKLHEKISANLIKTLDPASSAQRRSEILRAETDQLLVEKSFAEKRNQSSLEWLADLSQRLDSNRLHNEHRRSQISCS